jgi:hypothetical protein
MSLSHRLLWFPPPVFGCKKTTDLITSPTRENEAPVPLTNLAVSAERRMFPTIGILGSSEG